MMARIKMVSANISSYFEINKIEKRESVPVSGTYNKGDLIINIGPDASTRPIWLCTETGSPGTWVPVISGNVYVHPDRHPADMITEDSTHKFVTDNEKDKLNNIGDLSQLQTENKNDLVSAINEVFQSGNNAKQGLVDALVVKGIEASTSESWESLTNKVLTI